MENKDQQDLFSEPNSERGDLKWKDGKKDSEVEFVPNPGGRWMLEKALKQEMPKFITGIDPAFIEEDTNMSKIPFPNLIEEMKNVVQYYDGHIIEGKQRAFVGVDNGISGSIGIIYSDGTYEFFKSPVIKQQDYTKKKKLISRIVPNKFADILDKVGPGSMVFIERPMINSTRFNASMSAIRAYEMTITILDTLGLPYETVDSKDWQKALLPQGVSGDELKKASFDVGNRLFPNFKEVKHPDRDGMLIALHCKNKHK